MLLYYITDRRGFPGTEGERRIALLRCIANAARANVDLIQIREKDLSPRNLEQLAKESVAVVRENSETTRVLINSRTDIALSSGADGVHLAGGELPASEVRTLWMRASQRAPLIGGSTHSIPDVLAACSDGADFAVLAPIFEKVQTPARAIGLKVLQQGSCCWVGNAESNSPGRGRFAVLALGGVTLSNAFGCLQAGAAGIAGIRLFQNGNLAETVKQLRRM